MKCNRSIIYFLLLISISFQAKLNAQEDHLEPVRSIFDLYEFEHEYLRHVRKMLYIDKYFSTTASLLIIPAFSPENLLLIKRNDKTGTEWLVYYEPEKSIWYTLNKLRDNPNNEIETPKIPTVKTARALPKNHSQLLIELFSAALKQTKPRKEPIIGADGVMYYFNIPNLGFTGKVWSPQDGTMMRELVDINHSLITLVKKSSGDKTLEIDQALKERINKLTDKLNSQIDR